jgi:hypothetical protein
LEVLSLRWTIGSRWQLIWRTRTGRTFKKESFASILESTCASTFVKEISAAAEDSVVRCRVTRSIGCFASPIVSLLVGKHEPMRSFENKAG